ncbi:MAG: hypothetical protein WCL04_10965, partial [Verrucomicrobiota bacterium]
TIAATTIWAGKGETTAGVKSTPLTRANVSAQQGPANTIATIYSGAAGSLTGLTSTANNSHAVAIDNSLTGSWTKQEGASVAFGFFNRAQFERGTNFTSILGSFAVIDLYELQPIGGAAAYLGSFGLNSAGLLQFSNSTAAFALSAIPEPAVTAAWLGVLVLGLAVLHRRATTRRIMPVN